MSAALETRPLPTVAPPDPMEPPDDLWHTAADGHHDSRAQSGHSWRTLCGQLRPPARESRNGFHADGSCPACVELLRGTR